jgi:Tol biopolymer transport system component
MPLSGNLGHEFPGTPTKVNTEGIEVEWSGLSWSGNGKLIAFNDIPSKEKPEKENYQSIYVVDPAGGEPKEVINNYRDIRVVNYRLSLSPDGKGLAYTSVENNKQHIYIKDVTGGAQKQLVDNQAREPVYSPDGKWIAYVEDENLGTGGGNLWIIPESGGLPELVAKAGQATSPVWSPDGNTIAYLDYDKNKQINFVRVSKDTRTINKVTSIEAPGETEDIFQLSGWTPENKIGLLLITKRQFAIYTLPSNGGPASTVLSDGYISQPRWSPDGKRIFYTTQLNEGNVQTSRTWLASVRANGGSGQPLPEDKERVTLRLPEYRGGNRVSPDGKMIISSAWTSADTNSYSPNFPNFKLWKLAIDGSVSKQITNKQGPYADLYPCWSPDGREIAFLRVQIKRGGSEDYDKAGIYIVNASGGEPEILSTTSTELIFSPVWSPDGVMIAYLSKEREAPDTSYINVINVENGETKRVGEVPSVHVDNELAWSPDCKRIALNSDKVIKVMNVEDGKIEDISTGLVDVNIYHFDWSPDGERFVFSGWKGGNAEFWFMEDFLPLEKLAQKE